MKRFAVLLVLFSILFSNCNSLRDDVTFTYPIELSYKGIVGSYKITSLNSSREDLILNLNGDIFSGFIANSSAENLDLKLSFNQDSTYTLSGNFIVNTIEYEIVDNDTINTINSSRINTINNIGDFEIFIDQQSDIREIILDPGFEITLNEDVMASTPSLPIFYFTVENVEDFTMTLEDFYSNPIQRIVDERVTTLVVEKE